MMIEFDDFVYLIRHPDSFYKVGKSENPARRLRNLDSGSPYELEFDYLINTKNADSVEQNLHSILKKYQQKREWFDITRSELMEIVFNDSVIAKTNKSKIYNIVEYRSLFNPAKPGIIEVGDTIFINYIGFKGNDNLKMVKIKDADFEFDDSFKINSLNITLAPMNSGDVQLIQKRGGQLKIKNKHRNQDSMRDLSDDVGVLLFNEIEDLNSL